MNERIKASNYPVLKEHLEYHQIDLAQALCYYEEPEFNTDPIIEDKDVEELLSWVEEMCKTQFRISNQGPVLLIMAIARGGRYSPDIDVDIGYRRSIDQAKMNIDNFNNFLELKGWSMVNHRRGTTWNSRSPIYHLEKI